MSVEEGVMNKTTNTRRSSRRKLTMKGQISLTLVVYYGSSRFLESIVIAGGNNTTLTGTYRDVERYITTMMIVYDF